MNTLVTGGAGYIGSVLVQHLLGPIGLGHRVTVLDNFRHGVPSLAHLCCHERLDIVNGDARDPYTLKPLLEKHDVVIPLAAIVGAPACAKDYDLASSTNLGAIQLLVSYLSPAQRVLYPNTNSGYGVGGTAECDETSPLNPLSHYGRTKCQAEETLLQRENTIAFRLATVFGASPRFRLDLLLNEFVWRAVKDRAIVLFEGHFKRNFIHIKDVARAFMHSINSFETMKGNVYNVGLSTANLSKVELCELIKRHVPDFMYFEAAIGRDPDQRNYKVSNAKIEATGFTPRYSVDDGISELIKLYRGLSNQRYGNV